MRRTDREVTERAEIEQILNDSAILHLAIFGEDFPYIVPMHYGYEMQNGMPVFYLHCAQEGRKLELLRKNSAACVEIENHVETVPGGEVPCRYGAAYASVIAEGHVRILASPGEKIRGLELLMKHQTGRDFAFTEEMAAGVEVLEFTAETCTAKARKLG